MIQYSVQLIENDIVFLIVYNDSLVDNVKMPLKDFLIWQHGKIER